MAHGKRREGADGPWLLKRPVYTAGYPARRPEPPRYDRPYERTHARSVTNTRAKDGKKGKRDALVQRAAHGELFPPGIAQDLRGFVQIGVMELVSWRATSPHASTSILGKDTVNMTEGCIS